jgi:hypothetical protein
LTSSNRIDVLFLIETYLKSEVPDSIYEIPGFVLHRKDRPGNKKGGGILAFISEHLRAKRATDLEENELEVLWMNINPFNSNRPILFGTVYRPSSSNSDLDQRLERNIENAYLCSREIHILGDFNIDLFSYLILSYLILYDNGGRETEDHDWKPT